jgi:hypothetical protein
MAKELIADQTNISNRARDAADLIPDLLARQNMHYGSEEKKITVGEAMVEEIDALVRKFIKDHDTTMVVNAFGVVFFNLLNQSCKTITAYDALVHMSRKIGGDKFMQQSDVLCWGCSQRKACKTAGKCSEHLSHGTRIVESQDFTTPSGDSVRMDKFVTPGEGSPSTPEEQAESIRELDKMLAVLPPGTISAELEARIRKDVANGGRFHAVEVTPQDNVVPFPNRAKGNLLH